MTPTHKLGKNIFVENTSCPVPCKRYREIVFDLQIKNHLMHPLSIQRACAIVPKRAQCRLATAHAPFELLMTTLIVMIIMTTARSEIDVSKNASKI